MLGSEPLLKGKHVRHSTAHVSALQLNYTTAMASANFSPSLPVDTNKVSVCVPSGNPTKTVMLSWWCTLRMQHNPSWPMRGNHHICYKNFYTRTLGDDLNTKQGQVNFALISVVLKKCRVWQKKVKCLVNIFFFHGGGFHVQGVSFQTWKLITISKMTT